MSCAFSENIVVTHEIVFVMSLSKCVFMRVGMRAKKVIGGHEGERVRRHTEEQRLLSTSLIPSFPRNGAR